MQKNYPPEVRKLLEAYFTRPAETTPELRHAVTASAALIDDSTCKPEKVPPELKDYLDKVARHAYKITDEDFSNLKQAGYSEDQIFEVTIGAALGAGLARLEKGLTALRQPSK